MFLNEYQFIKEGKPVSLKDLQEEVYQYCVSVGLSESHEEMEEFLETASMEDQVRFALYETSMLQQLVTVGYLEIGDSYPERPENLEWIPFTEEMMYRDLNSGKTLQECPEAYRAFELLYRKFMIEDYQFQAK